MKKLFLLSALTIFISTAKSQEFDLGVHAGISRSSMVQNFADFGSANTITGFTGGLYTKFKFLGFFVMPEVNYTQRGGDIQNYLGQTVASNTIHYIDVPVLAGKQFFKFFRVNAGPVFQFAMGNETASSLATYTNNSSVNSFVLGLQAGAGIDIWKLSLDVRYDTGITDAAKVVVSNSSPTISSLNYSSRSSMFIFTLGYRFIKL